MINFKNKKILITGATGGIGNSLVKKFLSLDGTILATGTNTEKLDSLTGVEMNILKLISKSKTAKDIAEELFVSVRTVEKHKSHIRTKLVLDSKSKSLCLFAKENIEYL